MIRRFTIGVGVLVVVSGPPPARAALQTALAPVFRSSAAGLARAPSGARGATLQYVFNKQNPRWEAPNRGPAHQFHKPYKPLRQPPGNLPARKHRGQHGSLLFSRYVVAALSGVVALGIAAEWLGWLFGLPSTLVALVFGIVAGPATGFLDPIALLGHLLLPIVSLLLAFLLFDGALRWRRAVELGSLRALVVRLVSVGALLTWAISALAASFMLALTPSLAVLLGAILAIAGRPATLAAAPRLDGNGRLAALRSSEAAALELLGTAAVVLWFQIVLTDTVRHDTLQAVMNLFKVAWIGSLSGVAVGVIAMLLLRYEWIPERLRRAVMVMLVVGAFGASNLLQADAGFVAVIAMGLFAATQRIVPLAANDVFGDGVTPLLTTSLLIVLAASINGEDAADVALSGVALLSVAVFVARPAGVLLATWRSTLTWRDKLLLSCSAPGGVIGVTLATIFTLRLAEARNAQAAELVPLAAVVIFGTLALGSVTSVVVARFRHAGEPPDVLGQPTPAAR